MGYADPALQDQDTETRTLHDVHTVCVAAQLFFQQAARQVDDSNLRHKFLELAILHSNAANQLPASRHTPPAQIMTSELAAVQFWYLHQRAALHKEAPQQMLTELAGLLQQQLNVLKQLTKRVQSHAAKVTLAHLSAALQMANDQLLPLLKVLPADGQKIQTKN
ncbi:MAG TPA: hypothetical protein VFY01_03565 [Rheinheimera sp.]|nr:hypothetical protein [Rheinheimera sp.]